jgi:HlyD family secretion protein
MAKRSSRMGRRVILIVGIVLVLTAGGALMWRWWQRSQQSHAAGVLVASGTIEVEEVDVASELGGRVTALYVDEGDEVAAGQVLVQLDDAVYRAQLSQAQAAAGAARAAVARVEGGATLEEIAQARAVLSQTIAVSDGARAVWEAAQAVVEDPQQAIAQYHAARGARDAASAAVTSVAQSGYTTKEDARLLWYNTANSLRDAQDTYSRIYWRNRETEKDRDLTQAEKDEESAAWRQVENWERLMQIGEMNYNMAQTAETQNNAIAQSNLKTAQSLYSDMGWIVSEPLSVEAQAAQARAQYDQAVAAVQVAQTNLDRLLAGAAPADIDACQSQLRQAEAAVELLQLQVDRTTLKAPVSGIVLVRSIHQGELAVPGVPMLTLGDLDTVRLTIYIAEDVYGQVQLGQSVDISVDSYPGWTFRGEIVHIASQAEFTPKDVQTQEERVHLVYAVRVRVPNPEHLLKPGMPADAKIQLETGE